MKTIPVIYRFVIGLLVGLLLFATLIILLDKPKPGTSATTVAVQLAVDSVNDLYANATLQREDSIQRILYRNISMLQTERDTYKAKAKSAEHELANQQRTIAELEAEYAEQCGELITTYRERNDTCMSIIRTKTLELLTCDQQNLQFQTIARSQDVQIAELTKTVKTKNTTITTLKDRNTTIVNRMKRTWIKRNWLWMRGAWREYVLEE